MWKSYSHEVDDFSHVGEVRRAAVSLAEGLDLDEVRAGKLAIIVTELASNIVKHAGRGEIILTVTATSLEILALDKGPGIPNMLESLQDGYSTGGTAGNGLGAIKRMASEFGHYSRPGQGTVFHASFRKDGSDPALDLLGGLAVPLKGESVCGDTWAFVKTEEGLRIMVADGLGHGLPAYEASQQAATVFKEQGRISPQESLQLLHNSLRSTRGAAVSIADVDFGKQIVNFCGVGNVLGTLSDMASSKSLIAHNGTVGVQVRKIQSFPYPWNTDALLVIHSDGVTGHFNFKDYPGLSFKHPQLIAGVIYRDHQRVNDDSTVVVVRRPA